ncbi:hypothetical protein [Heyndrickxia ginsengihumi]|uniref:hypothetical protein n=1 Tax=Heyndrickxia ginsengihumi TaxID=363870 RepID=UPI00047295A0|nr:hypothetical protein [Heyndrickxia ginsengihumi]
MSEDNLGERVKAVETTVESHDKRIDRLEKNNESLTKLTTLMEIQTETNKEVANTVKSQQETLVKMNDNLDGLNTRVGKLEEEKNDNEINIMKDLIRPGIIAVVLTIIFIVIENATGIHIRQ